MLYFSLMNCINILATIIIILNSISITMEVLLEIIMHDQERLERSVMVTQALVDGSATAVAIILDMRKLEEFVWGSPPCW